MTTAHETKTEQIETTIDLDAPDLQQQTGGLPDPKDAGKAEESKVEIEIVDDTPPEDRRPPRDPKAPAKAKDDDDEVAGYSDKVQKRIKDLKYEYHEERRAKEAAARQAEEAIRYAQTVLAEKQRLEKVLESGSKTLKTSQLERIDAQLADAKRAFKAAYEAGEADKVADAQEAIAKLAAERERVNMTQEYKAPEVPQKQAQQQQTQQRQPPAGPTQRDMEWLQANQWFQKDHKMTGFAYGLHEDLVRSGVKPGTNDYYDKIDAEMRRVFADHFAEDEGRKPADAGAAPQRRANVAAPATRSAASTPRRVQLTTTQVAIAKRLGLTPEQYAAQVLKEMGNG